MLATFHRMLLYNYDSEAFETCGPKKRGILVDRISNLASDTP